jgi:hypothetical protein
MYLCASVVFVSPTGSEVSECLDSVERVDTREGQGPGYRYNSVTRHGT